MSRASDVPVVDCYWPLAFACGRQLCTCGDAETVVSRVSGIILYTRILLLVLCYFSAHYRKCLEWGNTYCNFQFSRTGTRTPGTGNWSTGSGKNAVMCLRIKITAQKVMIGASVVQW